MGSPFQKGKIQEPPAGVPGRNFFSSIVLYSVVSLAAFIPVLFRGQAYFDDDLLNIYSIFQQFLKSSLLHGQLPFWNPYLFAGQPFLPDPAAMCFYPLLYPCLFLPGAFGFGLFFLIHAFLAALGMHFWLRSLGMGREACWIGSISFALGGCFWGEIIHPILFASMAWTPWVFASLERLARRPTPQWAMAAGFLSALLGSTLHPQVLLDVFYGGIVYFSVRAFALRWRLSQAVRLAFFFIWGALPFCFLALPFLDFLRFSDRLKGPLNYIYFNADFSIKPSSLSQFLFPLPPFHSPAPEPYQNILANQGFCGLWLPFLVFLAFRAGRGKNRLLLAGLGFFFLLVSFGKYFPLHFLLYRFVPGFSLMRSPFRFVFLYSLAACALAAAGFDALQRKSFVTPAGSRTLALSAAVYTALILLAAWAGAPISGSILSLFLAGSAGLILGLHGTKGSLWGRRLFSVAFFLSMILTGWDISSSRLGSSSNLDFTKVGSLFSKIQKEAGEGRVFMGDHIPYPVSAGNQIFRLDLPANAACLFGVRNAGGYNELSLSQRGSLYTLPFPTFLKLMDIQGFATGNEKGQVPGFTRFQWGEVRFYASKEKMRLAYAPARLEVVPEESQRLALMRRKDFDPYQTAVLSEPPPENTAIGNLPAPKFDYSLASRGLNDESFDIGLDRPSWVVFSEPNYPGWRAWVDEKPAPIVTSNQLFRGINVPSGRHQIRFRFEPVVMHLAFFGILLWILSMLLYGGIQLFRKPS